MDFLKSLKGYGKMESAEEREFRRKTRSQVILIALTSIFLAITVGIVISVSIDNWRSEDRSSSPESRVSKLSSIKEICSVTRYPDTCFASLSAAATNSTAIATDPASLFRISLSVASRSISKLSSFISTLDIPAADRRLQAAVRDCKELLDDALGRLNDSSAILASAKPVEKILSDSYISDLKTWLSATITDQETCLDGFEGTTGSFREKLEAALTNSTRFTSNSLAIVTGILEIGPGKAKSIQEAADSVPTSINSP